MGVPSRSHSQHGRNGDLWRIPARLPEDCERLLYAPNEASRHRPRNESRGRQGHDFPRAYANEAGYASDTHVMSESVFKRRRYGLGLVEVLINRHEAVAVYGFLQSKPVEHICGRQGELGTTFEEFLTNTQIDG